MKRRILTAVLVLSCLSSFAQNWGPWIDVGQEIEVSFKPSKYGCSGYSYARIRNASNTRTFCRVTVRFTMVCNKSSSTREESVSAYNIKPGDVDERLGNWYMMDKPDNIRLTYLSDQDCKSLLSATKSNNGSISNSGVNEISYPRKNLGDEYQKKLDSLKEEQQKREKELDEKYEKQKKAIDEQAKRDKEKQDETEKIVQQKTESIANSNSYPNTAEGRLQKQFDADATRRTQNAQAISTTIDVLGNLAIKNMQRKHEAELKKDLGEDKLKTEGEQEEENKKLMKKAYTLESENKYSEALQLFHEVADNGDKNAMYRIGLLYEKGQDGLEKDIYKAEEWISKSCDAGNQTACNRLLYLPEYVALREEKQKKVSVDQQGEKSDGKAKLEWTLGITETDEGSKLLDAGKVKDALTLFLKAADKGNADAMCSIGYIFKDGYDGAVAKNYVEAFQWFSKAVDVKIGRISSHPAVVAFAMYQIGTLYEDGLGIEKNIKKAKEWYQKASDKGSAQAAKKLQGLN